MYSTRPTRSRSPPSNVPGGWMKANRRNGPSARAIDSVSGRREAAPGRVMIASSSSTTAVSSTKDRIGQVRLGRQAVQLAPQAGQAGLVLAVLRLGEVDVDGLALQVGQLTLPDLEG